MVKYKTSRLSPGCHTVQRHDSVAQESRDYEKEDDNQARCYFHLRWE